MLTAQRQRAILAATYRAGGVEVGQLGREHRVSDVTIRRDLATLQRQGLVTRVYGGAIATAARTHPQAGGGRAAAGRAIADRAAALARAGSTVAITAGPLAASLAHALAATPALTVVTNSLPAATTLTAHDGPDHHIVMLGGTQTRSGAYIGALAIAATQLVTMDLIYLGVTGMTTAAGFTVDDLVEADTDRAMIRRARRVVVLADHTMWGTVGLATVIRLSDAHTLVTDDNAPAVHRTLNEMVGEVIVAQL
jgi:DeoR/GlpR family transcriptional regulator of sugar metabolism